MYYALKRQGYRSWLRDYTAIGPRFTSSIKEAMRFPTEEEAKQHPAFSHPLLIIEVRKYQGDKS